MTDRARLQAITSWLNDLANLTAGQVPLADAKSKIAALALALAEDFPLAVFTRRSLVDVARDLKWFPSYSELCAVLSPWWKAHRMPVSAIEHDPSGLAKIARESVDAADSWKDISSTEVNAKIRMIADAHPPFSFAWGRAFAAAIKKHAPQHLGLLPPKWLDPEPARVVPLPANDQRP